MNKKKSLLKATLIVSLLTVVGKVFGFAREAIIAAFFGATAETDVFFFAQSVRNMLFPAVSSGLAAAFTTMYIKKSADDGYVNGERFASKSLIFALFIGCMLSIIGVILSPIIVPLFAPGFSNTQVALGISLTRLSMAAFTLMIMQYMLSAVLNAKRIFIASSIAGLAYNISIIALTVVGGPTQSMYYLTYAVIVGLAMQVVVLILYLNKEHFKFKVVAPFDYETGELLKIAIPVFVGDSVWQINNIVDKALSSTLDSGSLSALSYANSLNGLVIGIFVTSLTTVLFPTLTHEATTIDGEYNGLLTNSLKAIEFVIIPIVVVTLVYSEDIVQIVYGRGNFDSTAVKMTALVLLCYAPNFIFTASREVLSRSFFAIQNTKIPAKNSAIGVGCNIVFSIVLVRYVGIIGIAIGTTVSSMVSSLLLIVDIRRFNKRIDLKPLIKPILVYGIAGTVSFIVILVMKQSLLSSIPCLLRLITGTILCFSIYLLAIFMIKKDEISGMISLVRKKEKA